MSCPGANNDGAWGGISAANGLYIHYQAGHFRVISLIQPRHAINNYLRTTGEQARQDTGLSLVKRPELQRSDWSGHGVS